MGRCDGRHTPRWPGTAACHQPAPHAGLTLKG